MQAVGPNALVLGAVSLVASAVDYGDHERWWLLIPGALLIGLFAGALVDLLIALALHSVLDTKGKWKRGFLLGIPFWLLAAAIHFWA